MLAQTQPLNPCRWTQRPRWSCAAGRGDQWQGVQAAPPSRQTDAFAVFRQIKHPIVPRWKTCDARFQNQIAPLQLFQYSIDGLEFTSMTRIASGSPPIFVNKSTRQRAGRVPLPPASRPWMLRGCRAPRTASLSPALRFIRPGISSVRPRAIRRRAKARRFGGGDR